MDSASPYAVDINIHALHGVDSTGVGADISFWYADKHTEESKGDCTCLLTTTNRDVFRVCSLLIEVLRNRGAGLVYGQCCAWTRSALHSMSNLGMEDSNLRKDLLALVLHDVSFSGSLYVYWLSLKQSPPSQIDMLLALIRRNTPLGCRSRCFIQNDPPRLRACSGLSTTIV